MRRISPHAPVSPASRRRLARWLVGSRIRDIERDLVLETLANTHGNRTASARLLGVSVRTLRNKITEYSAEGFHIPHHENRDKILRAVPANTRPKDKAAAMPVALAGMCRVAASDCGS
jgi:Bacterial regulatory protein, Fis family